MVRTFARQLNKLLLILVIALASVQFASHSVRPDITDPQLVAYLASGGTLADLCQDGEGEYLHPDCPFCREADLFALAPRLPSVEPVARIAESSAERLTAVLSPPLVTGVPPARAPPVA